MPARGKASRLQASEARVLVGALIDTIQDPLLVLDHELRIASANRSFLALAGLDRAEVEGRRLHEVGEGGWNLAELRQLMASVQAGGETAQALEVSHDFPRAGRRTLLLNARRIEPLQLILLVIEDITARAEAQEQRQLLLAELKHRVKNTLALVQSVAVHTGRKSPSIDQFMVVFGERLRALGRVHDLMVRTNSSGAGLEELIEHTLANHRLASRRSVEIEGEPIQLNARHGQSLGLVLHELASNAVLHGALSVPAGSLRIAWRTERRDGARWLRLLWQESGGPKVTTPSGAGFGRTVIERASAYELRGIADLRFEPDGLRYELAFPLE